MCTPQGKFILLVPLVPDAVTLWSHLFELWCVSNAQRISNAMGELLANRLTPTIVLTRFQLVKRCRQKPSS